MLAAFPDLKDSLLITCCLDRLGQARRNMAERVVGLSPETAEPMNGRSFSGMKAKLELLKAECAAAEFSTEWLIGNALNPFRNVFAAFLQTAHEEVMAVLSLPRSKI